jgi:hypothetical protein
MPKEEELVSIHDCVAGKANYQGVAGPAPFRSLKDSLPQLSYSGTGIGLVYLKPTEAA